jgi:hypothetical protein
VIEHLPNKCEALSSNPQYCKKKKKKIQIKLMLEILAIFGRLRSGGSRFEASRGKYFARHYLQNNQSKMDWSCHSNSRGPAL